jgi:hypothetical protein
MNFEYTVSYIWSLILFSYCTFKLVKFTKFFVTIDREETKTYLGDASTTDDLRSPSKELAAK